MSWSVYIGKVLNAIIIIVRVNWDVMGDGWGHLFSSVKLWRHAMGIVSPHTLVGWFVVNEHSSV